MVHAMQFAGGSLFLSRIFQKPSHPLKGLDDAMHSHGISAAKGSLTGVVQDEVMYSEQGDCLSELGHHKGLSRGVNP